MNYLINIRVDIQTNLLILNTKSNLRECKETPMAPHTLLTSLYLPNALMIPSNRYTAASCGAWFLAQRGNGDHDPVVPTRRSN